MKCVEYIYKEEDAKKWAEELNAEGFEDVEIEKTVDEDADEPFDVWVLSWIPKPLKK